MSVSMQIPFKDLQDVLREYDHLCLPQILPDATGEWVDTSTLTPEVVDALWNLIGAEEDLQEALVAQYDAEDAKEAAITFLEKIAEEAEG